MVTTFLFDILPGCLEKAAAAARSSFLYGLLARLWQVLLGLWEGSLCCRLWQGSLRIQLQESLVVRGLDGLLRWLTDFLGKCFGWMVTPIRHSALALCLQRIPRFNFAWVYGAAVMVIFCCPGPLWRNAYGLLLAVLLFGAALVERWYHDAIPLQIREPGLSFAVFCLAAVAAVAMSADRGEAVRVLCFYVTALLLCAGAVATVTNRGRLMAILGFLYGALLLTALYALLQRFQGVEVDASLTDVTVNAGMPGRVYSTLENPNNYAEFIVLAFPLSLVFCANITDRRWKTLAVGSLLIPVVALLMTYSRSGWVSFALAAVVFLALYDKRLLPLVLLAAVAAVPLLPESIFNRILTIGSTADSSNAYRLYIWDSALEMIRDHGLLGIGLGPGNFTPLYAEYCHPIAEAAQHSHMLYLEVWLEMGLLGIAGFLVLYLGTLRRAIRARNHTDPLLRHVLTAGVSALAGVSFVGAAEYIWFYPRVMFAFFLTLGVTLAAVKLAREPE